MGLIDEWNDVFDGQDNFARRCLPALLRRVRQVMGATPTAQQTAFSKLVLASPMTEAKVIAIAVRVAMAIAGATLTDDVALQTAVNAVFDLYVSAGVS